MKALGAFVAEPVGNVADGCAERQHLDRLHQPRLAPPARSGKPRLGAEMAFEGALRQRRLLRHFG